MNLETLYVEIKAQMEGFNKSMNTVKSQLSGLDKTAKKVSSSIQKSVNKMSSGFKKLGSVLGKALSAVALVKLGKAALSAASDLEEVQNVVNVVFGESAGEIDAWARHCITAFGLTEKEAKEAAGSFKAMANSMGVADKSGKTISLRLTELAADLASFYNTDLETARNALNGVFTGQTMSLTKQFGVVMTQAELEAFRLSQGITKSYNSMSAAEKVALRYKYVLQATADAQGDFARSSNSWANQIKVLKAQWQSFLSVLGTALRQVILPLVQGLNNVLASLISIAKTVGGLLGIDFSSTAAKVSSTAGAAVETAEGFDDATSSAKELQKTIAGFDELEVLTSNASSGGESGGGAGGGTASGLEIDEGAFDATETEKPVIKSLGDVLKTVDDWFNNTMSPWLKQKADWLAGNINDAVDKLPWGDIGKTIADGANGIIAALDTFYDKLDGYNLGAGLSTFLNKFVETFDAKLLGKTIGDKIELALDFVLGVLENLNTEGIGQALADLFNNLDIVTLAGKFGKVLSEVAIGGLEILNAFLSGADATQLSEALAAFFNAINFEGIKEQIAELIGNLLDKFKEIIGGLSDVDGNLKIIIDSLNNIIKILAVLAGFAIIGALGDIALKLIGVKGGIKSVAKEMTGAIKVFGDMSAVESIKMSWSMIGQTIAAHCSKIATSLSSLGKGIVSLATGPVGIIIAAIAAVVAGLITAYKTNDEFRARVDAFYAQTIKPILEETKLLLEFLWDDCVKPLWEELQVILSKLWELVTQTLSVIGVVVGDIMMLLVDKLAPVIRFILEVVTVVISAVLSGIEGFLKAFEPYIDAIIGFLQGVIDFLTGVFTGDWSKAWEGVKEIFKNVFDALVLIAKAPLNLIIGFINGVIKGIEKGINGVIRVLNKISIKVPDWVPVFGGDVWGFNLQEKTIPPVAYLAHGGVITDPTLAMMGEYPGARHNPEIAVPQNTLEAIINSHNEDLIDAMAQLTRQVIGAVEGVDMSVTIGDDVIAQSAARGANNYKRRTGKPLFAY